VTIRTHDAAIVHSWEFINTVEIIRSTVYIKTDHVSMILVRVLSVEVQTLFSRSRTNYIDKYDFVCLVCPAECYPMWLPLTPSTLVYVL